MTDAFPSQFEAPSRYTGGSAFIDLDAHRAERNLDAINLTESVSRFTPQPGCDAWSRI